jgi:phage host-nuclease inhibitor protein Gam
VDGRRILVKPNLEAALLEFRRQPPILAPVNQTEKTSAILRSVKVLNDEVLRQKPYAAQSTNEFDRIDVLTREYNTAVKVNLDEVSQEVLHKTSLQNLRTLQIKFRIEKAYLELRISVNVVFCGLTRFVSINTISLSVPYRCNSWH